MTASPDHPLIEHLASELEYHRSRADYHVGEVDKCRRQIEAYSELYRLPRDYRVEYQTERPLVCTPHPAAPHGFDRTASHSEGRYVCVCESWTPGDAS